ncbi:hypothetical protein R1sor_014719 [Riccia sorocarpa]|uniref:Uncharacterized protein n=1 Tax=Riccia sorocarpa TaxID=122646 RepID=A0ABD3HA77_9MARC
MANHTPRWTEEKSAKARPRGGQTSDVSNKEEKQESWASGAAEEVVARKMEKRRVHRGQETRATACVVGTWSFFKVCFEEACHVYQKRGITSLMYLVGSGGGGFCSGGAEGLTRGRIEW